MFRIVHALNLRIFQGSPVRLRKYAQFTLYKLKLRLYSWLSSNPITDSTCYPYTSGTVGEPGSCKTYCSDYTPLKQKYSIKGFRQLLTTENIKDSLLMEGSVLVVMKRNAYSVRHETNELLFECSLWRFSPI